MNKDISILIPVRNEEAYIGQCLSSIVNGYYPRDKMEILVIDGISEDKTVDIVKNFSANNDKIKLFKNSKRTTPYALNIGIEKSMGDYIFIAGAHTVYSEDYFIKLIKWAEKLNADCVGGILKTETLTNNTISSAIKFVLTNKWGVGNALFRTGVESVQEVDTVAYGCYNNNVFKKYGHFNEELTRNQDIEYNLRIKRGKGKIFLVPDVYSIYYARNNYYELAKNNFLNGLWNVYTVYYTKSLRALSFRHFIPFVFIMSIILPILGAILFPTLIIISLSVIFVYILFISLICSNNSDKQSSFFEKVRAFVVLHFSYGIGSLFGIFKIFKMIIK